MSFAVVTDSLAGLPLEEVAGPGSLAIFFEGDEHARQH